MKFCPNCGFPLNEKKICECGYNIETNEVDKEISEKYNQKPKENYERQCDNNIGFGMQMQMHGNSMGLGMHMNGNNIETQEVIFNKEPDIIMGIDYIEEMKQLQKDIEEVKKND